MIALLLGRATPALAALLANAGIELRALLPLGGFSALLADFGIEGRAELLLDGLAALFANARIELWAVLLADSLPAVFRLVGTGFWPSLAGSHRMHLFASQLLLRSGKRLDTGAGDHNVGQYGAPTVGLLSRRLQDLDQPAAKSVL